ncbi:3534_t:CDS:2 [Paraglomus occultum]|uniref:3534_t:CDS:1 n=1 Tax=Paraglomus occultum TaxID=144539 RepID=A0A9N9A034_9GLOM|nr:3534_t:CDS:2 [Paraglomus occultum]
MAESASRARKNAKKKDPVDDIPEEEKIRLIKETGLLKNFEKVEFNQTGVEDEYYGWTFLAFLYTIPLCSVYCVMDIMVHRQYNQDVEFMPFFVRVAKMSPILWVFVYFSNKYCHRPLVQFAMFLGSIFCGCYVVYLLQKAPYLGVMRRCPPLSTLWTYFVAQLRLPPAVLSLLSVLVYYYLYF